MTLNRAGLAAREREARGQWTTRKERKSRKGTSIDARQQSPSRGWQQPTSAQALLDLAGVGPAFSAARAAVDAALTDPVVRRAGRRQAAEAALSCAVASAALEGSEHDIADVRAGVVTDPVVQGSLRVAEATSSLSRVWLSAPRQALARLHTLAARGCPGIDDHQLGRPADPVASAPAVDSVCAWAVQRNAAIPALLRAALIHGQLLAARPFAGPNGVVARAAARLCLISEGLDPTGLLALAPQHLALRPQYIGCANAFATGTPDGLRAWLKHCAAATVAAADQLRMQAQGRARPAL